MTKQYSGDIPFDLFGNQRIQDYSYTIDLKAENIHGNQLWISVWDGALNKYVLRLSVYDVFESDAVIFDQPRQGGHPDVIGYVRTTKLVPNYCFVDTLKYIGYNTGRSSAHMLFRSESTQREYSCFLSDFSSFVTAMDKGVIHNTRFTFCKKGNSYGLKIA